VVHDAEECGQTRTEPEMLCPERRARSRMRGMKIMKKLARLSSWDVIYAFNMAIAYAIAYWVMTQALISVINKDSDLWEGRGRRWPPCSCFG
jgi:hypothetical protein